MIEQLAALAHEQWSGWMEYLFDMCVFNEDGTATIPAQLVLRWLRQKSTAYSDLPEDEKDADRIEAAKVMAILNKISTQE